MSPYIFSVFLLVKQKNNIFTEVEDEPAQTYSNKVNRIIVNRSLIFFLFSVISPGLNFVSHIK